MKYNIFTVLNSSYVDFGKIFIKSLHKNLQLSKINNIFVGDTGLSKEDLSWLHSYQKVKIINSGYNTKNTQLWSDDWLNNVCSKTELLKKLITEQDLPIVMIDVDCMFVKDFYQDLDMNNDVEVCYREGHQVPYIGSFVSINKKKEGLIFLNEWIETIKKIKGVPKESPALSKICKENNIKLKIKKLEERTICAYCDSEEMKLWNSRIVHFKSRKNSSSFKDDFIDRTISRGFKNYIEDYVNVQSYIS